MIEIDGDINCLGLENMTPLEYFLRDRRHVGIYRSKYREILETLIFENSDTEMNHTVTDSALQLSHDTSIRVFGSFRPGQTQTGLRSHRS